MAIRQPESYLQGSGAIRVGGAILNNADIISLPTVAVQILPAPGVKKAIIPVSGLIVMESFGAYTPANVPALAFVDNAGNERSSLMGPGWNFALRNTGKQPIGVGFPRIYLDAGDYSGLVVVDFNFALQNRPLMIKDLLAGVDYTGGNPANTLAVTILYAVLDV